VDGQITAHKIIVAGGGAGISAQDFIDRLNLCIANVFLTKLVVVYGDPPLSESILD